MEKKDVTIFVSSCDLYEDAWMPLLKLLKKQWPECEYPVVLCTEEKEYDCDFMDVKTICTGKNLSWTARIRSVLNRIDTEFVLFLLEDYFLTDRVDVKGFEKALELIRSDSQVGMVHFVPTEMNMPVPENDLEGCYYELPIRKTTFRTRVAITLFRKEYFFKLLYQDENPWQYERESHIRSMFAGYKIIRQDYRKYPPVFPYILDHNAGIGITARKWLPKTKDLFEKNGIYGVNFDNLGFLSNEERTESASKKIQEIGIKQWIFNHFIHPIKVKLRHFWIFQDVINLKKYIKYWSYYQKMDAMR